MTFNDLTSRLTGMSIPIFGMSWTPPASERDAAKRVVTFLEDRRVLYNNGVKFDSFRGGSLIDAKGPGYAQFVKNGQFVSWFKGADALVGQAQRQVAAAGGAAIQWHVAEQSAAQAMRKLLEENRIRGIEVVYTPAK